MAKYRFLVEVEFDRDLDPDEAQEIRAALESFVAGNEISEMPDVKLISAVMKGPAVI
jgi:hypothetical protein